MNCRWRHTTTDQDGRQDVREGEISGDYGEREPGNHSLPIDLLKELPFAFKEAIAFDRRYLAGAVVEQYDADIFEAWDPARKRLEQLEERLVAKDARMFAGPEERWPHWTEEKGWLILTPFYTTTVKFRGKSHQIVIDGHNGHIASTVPPFISLGGWLLIAGVAASVLAFMWWVISLLIGWLN
jgi:hypothetical protein